MKTKLLIVDDSRIFRNAVAESLAGEANIEVIGSVWNGEKAIEFIRSNPPNLVTLDVEMPGMDGLETLEAIQKINASQKGAKPIGVIMLSSHTREGADITVKALEMGAFDFIPKPEGRNLKESFEILRRQLVVKIRHFAAKSISAALQRPPEARQPVFEDTSKVSVPSRIRGILIGVSTGGPRALTEMLPPLCKKVDIPIFIVQHMPPTFTQSLARSLHARCRYTVMEGKNNDLVRKQHAYIAPGGKHMLLTKRRNAVMTVINDQPPRKGCRPSVDILFRSGATVYGRDTIGVILTGMGADGTEGARILKRTGAIVVAQDEESSVVWGMPGSAKASGSVDKVLPLDKIPGALVDIMLKSDYPSFLTNNDKRK
jgi:two-component system chemotaxis response regulator CheB